MFSQRTFFENLHYGLSWVQLLRILWFILGTAPWYFYLYFLLLSLFPFAGSEKQDFPDKWLDFWWLLVGVCSQVDFPCV